MDTIENTGKNNDLRRKAGGLFEVFMGIPSGEIPKQLKHSERWEETNADGLKGSFPSSFILFIYPFFVN